MPTIIDMKGVWSAAKNTQAEIHDVNRPGYQGTAKASPVARQTRAKKVEETK